MDTEIDSIPFVPRGTFHEKKLKKRVDGKGKTAQGGDAMKNLSDKVASKQTAKNRFFSSLQPMTNGFFRDNSWNALSQCINGVRALGGEIEVWGNSYFSTQENACAGKRWFATATVCGHSFPVTFTATFADGFNGDVYDFTVTS